MPDPVTPDPRAAAFVAARRATRAVPVYPGAYPATEAEAYAIQADAIALWRELGAAVAGWKVGLIQPPFAGQLGRSRLFGPIFASNVAPAGPGPSPFRCIPNGFSAVEAEYVLTLGADVPPAEDWTPAQAAELVSAVHVGVEFAGSPFPAINDHGPLVTISDFGNNAGLLLGAELDGLAALEGHLCAMWVDGVKIADGGAHGILGGPLGSLVELLNHNGRMRTRLPAGTLVSTGAATGVHQVRIGQSAVADFGADGRIAISMQEPSA